MPGSPGARIESRLDGAFFDQKILKALDGHRVEFTMSVPFERIPELKGIVERRRRWAEIDPEWSYFEPAWNPKSWQRGFRFLVIRHLVPSRTHGPLQLDLFEPCEPGVEYKVIVTNKRGSARKVLPFLNGRGSQEGIFAEAKSHASLSYVPSRTLHGNQLYSLAALMAHNLGKEIQMHATPKRWRASPKRGAQWPLESLRTIRHRFLLRAGRLTRHNRRLTLTLNANPPVQAGIERLLAVEAA